MHATGWSRGLEVTGGISDFRMTGDQTLDLVRIGADGSPRWLRVWPTPEGNPRHAGLELWMAVHGHQMVSKPASWFTGASRRAPDPNPHTRDDSGAAAVARFCAGLLRPAAPDLADQGLHGAALAVQGLVTAQNS
jgi:hypothetical protein